MGICHVGDIADGTVEVRELQATPLASVNATLSRVYVTGNHEYFSEAEGWPDYMESIGWAALHNLHMIVSAAVTGSLWPGVRRVVDCRLHGCR